MYTIQSAELKHNHFTDEFTEERNQENTEKTTTNELCNYCNQMGQVEDMGGL